MASDICGVSGRTMLEALIVGERDPALLADLAKRRTRSKIPELKEAPNGRFSEHHAFLARLHLDLIDQHSRALEELTRRIEVAMGPFRLTALIEDLPDLLIESCQSELPGGPTIHH